jgi:hypothetical protein
MTHRRVSRWYVFVTWLTDVDEWLHEYARWLDNIPLRMSFCQWVWAEWHVWTYWLEGTNDPA